MLVSVPWDRRQPQTTATGNAGLPQHVNRHQDTCGGATVSTLGHPLLADADCGGWQILHCMVSKLLHKYTVLTTHTFARSSSSSRPAVVNKIFVLGHATDFWPILNPTSLPSSLPVSWAT